MSENKTEADTPTERYFTVVYKLTDANVAKYLSNRDWVTYIYTDSMAELTSLKELTAQAPSQPGGFSSGDMASAAAQGYRDGWTAAQTVAEPGTAYAAALDTLLGAIMGAAYDFRDAHLSGSGNIKRHAHAELESTVRSALAASHGQAPAGAGVLGPDALYEIVHGLGHTTHEQSMEIAIAVSDLAPADSVLEDAARYRLVRRGQRWSVIDGIGNDLRAEALDAAVDAARKQGGA